MATTCPDCGLFDGHFVGCHRSDTYRMEQERIRIATENAAAQQARTADAYGVGMAGISAELASSFTSGIVEMMGRQNDLMNADFQSAFQRALVEAAGAPQSIMRPLAQGIISPAQESAMVLRKPADVCCACCEFSPASNLWASDRKRLGCCCDGAIRVKPRRRVVVEE